MWIDEQQTDSSALAEVKASIDKWRELKFAMDEAESKFLHAKNTYEEYVKNELVGKLRTNGIESLGLEDGAKLELQTQYKCSIKKDEASKMQVAEWLREQGMDNLVKNTLIVMPSAKAKLDELHIPYDEDIAMNTNSIKAYIKGEMQINNIKQEDLPKGLSWYQWDDVIIKE
jgi:hypothetical protein